MGYFCFHSVIQVKVKYIRGTPRTHELILSTAASYRNVTDTSIAERLRPDDFCYVNGICLKGYLDFNDDCHSLITSTAEKL